LLDNLALWAHQVPTPYDFHSKLEIFNLENYLYVLYGMQFGTDLSQQQYRFNQPELAAQMFGFYRHKATQLQSQLLPHRELLNRIRQFGLQKV